MSQVNTIIRTGSVALLINLVSMAIKFGSNLLLAWFLLPEYFGVAAIVTAIVIGMELLSDVGINDSIIRHEKGEDPVFCSTAWIAQAGRGIVLYLILVLAAPFVALFYGMPELKHYLYVAGLALPIQGLKSVYLVVLQRRMMPLPELKLELLAQALAAIVMLSLAWQFQTVWVLMSAFIVIALVEVICSHLLTPKSFYLFRMSPQYFKEILHFGKWIYVGTVGAFLIINIDKLLIGKIESLSVLGVYQVAAAFSMISYSLAVSLLDRLIYPALADSARQNNQQMQASVQQLKRLIFPAITSMQLLVFLIAPYFFSLLYPTSFQNAAWMAQLMAILVWIMLAADFQGTILIAFNKPKLFAIVLLIVALLRPIFGIIAYQYFGLQGFILGMTGGSLFGFFCYRYLLNRELQFKENYELIIATMALSSVSLIYLLSHTTFSAHIPPVAVSVVFGIVIMSTFFWTIKKVMITPKPLAKE